MKTIRTLLLVLLTAAICMGCSTEEKETSSGDTIDAKARKVGHEAAKTLKTPMEKAESLARDEEKRTRDLYKQTDK